MVPRKFNIVDFDGFDLAGQYGEALPGIYDKIVDAFWNCVYIMCFGLKFAGFDIAPQYMVPEMFSDHIMLNGIISIDQNDVITIPSIEPEPPAPVITYELLEYIESNGTQGINIGRKIPTSANILCMYLAKSGMSLYPWVFGAQYGANTYAGLQLEISTNKSIAWNGTSTVITRADIRYVPPIDNLSLVTTSTESTANLWIFALGRSTEQGYSSMSKIRLYYCKCGAWTFLPCRRKSDGVCGLWDAYAGVFLTDSLNGDPFVAGPVLLEF